MSGLHPRGELPLSDPVRDPGPRRQPRDHHAGPHPYILLLENHGSKTTRHVLRLTLIGKAIEHLPIYLHALSDAGRQGIGPGRTRLAAIDATVAIHHRGGGVGLHGADAPPGGPFRVVLATPLRIKHDNDLAGPNDLTPHIFLLALARRIAQLDLHHGSRVVRDRLLPPDLPDEFVAKALTWVDLDRYSSRQGRKHKMGGLIGEFIMRLDDPAPLWPTLIAGQYLHAGKLATAGLGAYRLMPL